MAELNTDHEERDGHRHSADSKGDRTHRISVTHSAESAKACASVQQCHPTVASFVVSVMRARLARNHPGATNTDPMPPSRAARKTTVSRSGSAEMTAAPAIADPIIIQYDLRLQRHAEARVPQNIAIAAPTASTTAAAMQ